MQPESNMCGTYPAGRSHLCVPLKLPLLNVTKSGLCIATGNKTGTHCSLLPHPALANFISLLPSALIVFGGLLLKETLFHPYYI
jgi:hypothetical protein